MGGLYASFLLAMLTLRLQRTLRSWSYMQAVPHSRWVGGHHEAQQTRAAWGRGGMSPPVEGGAPTPRGSRWAGRAGSRPWAGGVLDDGAAATDWPFAVAAGCTLPCWSWWTT